MTANAPTNDEYWTDAGNYADSFAGGSGAETDPYLISTPQQLARLAYLVNNSSTNSQYASLYYEQTADLDMSVYYWDAIGVVSYAFEGYYDGGGYTISGLYTEAGSTSAYSFQGLFGYISGDRWHSIHDITIIDSNISGYSYVGGIAGYVADGLIRDITIIDSNISGYSYVGGIAGYCSSSGRIYNCSNYATINANGMAGGLVGVNFADIYNCYNAGSITISVISSGSGHIGIDSYKNTILFEANGGQGSMDSVEVEPNASVTLPECDFTRTGYEFAGWALSSTGVVVYSDGQTITPTANMTLYAVWREAVYEISIYWNHRRYSSSRPRPDTTIYYRYGGTFYSDQTCLSPLSATDLVNSKVQAGYSFVSFTTKSDGSGDVMLQNNQYLNTNLILSDDDWYAHWKANVEAKYDSEGDYWYVENGKMPQTKVTDSGIISALNSTQASSTSYYIAGDELPVYMYNGTEYCQWNNNWYEVEPIRWRLGDYSHFAPSSSGFLRGTTNDTYAVLDKIVFVGQYSTSSVGEGYGYSPISTTEFMQNSIDTTYLVDYTASTQTFGDGTTLYGADVEVLSKIFVSSQEEIEKYTGTTTEHSAGTTAVEFSDLASDIIKFYGGTNVYFTRDLGSNYNNIVCFNESGSEVQRNATLYRGVQFTICYTEHAYIW